MRTKKIISYRLQTTQSGEIAIPRIYAEVDENTLAQLEELAEKNGCSRRQLVLDAIDRFLNYKEPDTSEVDQLKSELNQAISERDLEISQRNDDLENAKSSIDKLAIDQNHLRSEILSIKEENERLQRDLEHSSDTIKQKNEEIAFLRNHTHQLAERIISALPSGKNERKAKEWWKFW